METTIEWTKRTITLPSGETLTIQGYTHNIVWGCTPVTEECRDCYAKPIAAHYGHKVWGINAPRRIMSTAYWNRPRSWHRAATQQGYKRLVFCSSMADTFEDHHTVAQERLKLWPLIEETDMLIWLLLTKRPENILKYVPPAWKDQWPENAWVGTSAGLQKNAERNLPYLFEAPASVHFLSAEPLIGPLDLSKHLGQLQWVITGGESGPRPRPIQPEWVRSLRDQCQEANVPFHLKQWGGRYHNSGGRLLDGRTWEELPYIDDPASKVLNSPLC